MKLSVEFERETDGRWICVVSELPGAMAYGATRDEAMRRAEALALEFIADKLQHGEPLPFASATEPLNISFVAA